MSPTVRVVEVGVPGPAGSGGPNGLSWEEVTIDPDLSNWTDNGGTWSETGGVISQTDEEAQGVDLTYNDLLYTAAVVVEAEVRIPSGQTFDITPQSDIYVFALQTADGNTSGVGCNLHQLDNWPAIASWGLAVYAGGFGSVEADVSAGIALDTWFTMRAVFTGSATAYLDGTARAALLSADTNVSDPAMVNLRVYKACDFRNIRLWQLNSGPV